MRDKSVDIMLAFGILFVVMGHNYQLPWLFFPAYTFHMPLFFFISGYLFKALKVQEKKKFILKKIKSQLIPYYIYNVIFILITLLLQRFGIFEAYDFSIEKILLEPFISGCQNPLIIPMWFLLQLFLLNIIFQFIYWSDSENNFYAITLLIVIIGLFSAYKGLADCTGWRLLVVRTGIAAIFFQFGIIISRYRNKIIPFLKNPVILFSIWIIVVLITAYFGNIQYSIIWGSVKNQLFYIPVLTSCLIVLIVFGISQILSESIDNNSLLITIGQNTFYIMALHFSFFFLVNVVFYVIGKINKENLSDVFFHYEVSKNFIFYLVAGIIGPVIIGKVDKKLKQKIRSLLNY